MREALILGKGPRNFDNQLIEDPTANTKFPLLYLYTLADGSWEVWDLVTGNLLEYGERSNLKRHDARPAEAASNWTWEAGQEAG